jgi:3-deoxy-D-manno-octulosonic-acid transferase
VTITARPEARRLPEPIVRDPNPGLWRALLHAVYDLAWLAGIALSSPWWALRALGVPRFRRMLIERFTLDLAGGGPPCILVHGVSVGEVKVALSFARELARRRPGAEVVISATTDTGLEVARKQHAGRVVRYPFDLAPVVGRFLGRVRPSAVVLVELELWPNFLRCANRAGIPVAVINGRMTPHSFGQYLLFRHALPQFNRVSLFCAQLEEYAERFRSLGGDGERALVTGNLKADSQGGQAPAAEALAALRALFGLVPGRAVVVAGSTHEPEERELCRAWRESIPEARWILVPRHPERSPAVARALAELGLAPQLLSELRAGAPPDPSRPALVDSIGELEAIYALADLVFVGGSLVPHGGQNVLEPAALGRPVVHGPHMANFAQEAALLERAGASLTVAGAAESGALLKELLADPARRERMGAAGRAAVAAQRGALERTLAALEARGCLGAAPPPTRAP